ncbi:hypothetical protein [Stenomitos frigidus]|nr:hypothetical protein [Stenomitos frigidus]
MSKEKFTVGYGQALPESGPLAVSLVIKPAHTGILFARNLLMLAG